jgi:hypothetical protein
MEAAARALDAGLDRFGRPIELNRVFPGMNVREFLPTRQTSYRRYCIRSAAFSF